MVSGIIILTHDFYFDSMLFLEFNMDYGDKRSYFGRQLYFLNCS